MNTVTPNLALAKKLNIVAFLLSFVVLALVGMMRRPEFKIATDIDFSFLPPFHAFVNALTAVALTLALYQIKQKNIAAHQRFIYLALGLSVVFLLSYVVYHFTTEETRFGDANHDGLVSAEEIAAGGSTRTLYFFFLITHVVLAGGILPFILFTFIRAYTGQIDKHRRMAKWVFPLWWYVAVTGPICYLMLRPYY